MKKLLIIISVVCSNISFAQKETFIKNEVTESLDEYRNQLKLNSFKSHSDLTTAIDYYLTEIISGNIIDIEALSKKYQINVATLNVYPVRYFNETTWKEQLQQILDDELSNNSTLNDLYFYRRIAVKKSESGEYFVAISYGTHLSICGRPDYTNN